MSEISPKIDIANYVKKLKSSTTSRSVIKGHVRKVTSGMIVHARLPNAQIGQICTIEGKTPIRAQIIGFDDEDVFLTPLDPLENIGPKTPVICTGEILEVPVGNSLLGRVVNALGSPLDSKGPLKCDTFYPVKAPAPESMKRKRITTALPVGIRAVDLFTTLGRGQRLGVFSTAGVGKSNLLGMIARNSTADVNVLALVGERGREVLDFIETTLGEEGLAKSVIVVATSDEPPLRRVTAAYTATAIAEYFRDQGKNVMLLMDSVTRFGRALREIALSLGEPPARQGFPPSVFAALPELLERAGNTEKGSITGLYTILLSSEHMEDPLGEEIRAILDGHIFLSSRLAQSNHYPAVDLLKSKSRVMDAVVDEEHKAISSELLRLWSIYEENRDLILLGAYKKGTDKQLDEALEKRPALLKFLLQDPTERDSLELTIKKAKAVMAK